MGCYPRLYDHNLAVRLQNGITARYDGNVARLFPCSCASIVAVQVVTLR